MRPRSQIVRIEEAVQFGRRHSSQRITPFRVACRATSRIGEPHAKQRQVVASPVERPTETDGPCCATSTIMVIPLPDLSAGPGRRRPFGTPPRATTASSTHCL
jgi:hypothetical protein